jgi:hypothetical protein
VAALASRALLRRRLFFDELQFDRRQLNQMRILGITRWTEIDQVQMPSFEAEGTAILFDDPPGSCEFPP